MIVLAFITILFISYYISNLLIIKGYSEYKIKYRFAFFIFIILTLITGLRNIAIGADTYQYYLTFNNIDDVDLKNAITNAFSNLINNEGKDPGFILLQILFKKVAPSFRLFMIFVDFVFFYGAFSLIVRNTNNLRSCCIAYLIMAAMLMQFAYTGLRQTLAFGIEMYAIKYVQEGKALKYFLLVILALSIHFSAIIIFFIYFIRKIKINRVIIIAIMSSLPLLFYFSQNLSYILGYISGKERYLNYALYYYESKSAIFYTVLVAVVNIYSVINYKTINTNNNILFINTVAISLLLMPIYYQNPSLLRLVMYFLIFIPVYITKITDSINNKILKKQLYFAISIIIIILFIKTTVNYAFLWEETQLGNNYGLNLIIKDI